MSSRSCLTLSFTQPSVLRRTRGYAPTKRVSSSTSHSNIVYRKSRSVPRAELVSDSPLQRPPKWLLQVNEGLVGGALKAIDMMYGGRAGPWSRLWVLEVIARVPYFSFLCALHLAETLGYGNDKITSLQRAHFAEADNEAAHLAIMEALGGGSQWRDRFVAQHAAIMYYWLNVIGYIVSPSLSYHFSQLVENHAYLTYDKILNEKESFLKHQAPVPLIAREYYLSRDAGNQRIINSMYDAIEAIRDDEAEHASDLGRYCEESFGNVPWRNSATIERDV